MKDRTRIEDSLALAKELLNLKQLTVAQYGLQWRHIGISAQHEYPIEASLLGELAGIDLECRLTADGTALAQIAPVASVADQCLLTAPQRILQSCDDGLTIATILLRLRLVATDDVAPTFDCYLLGK